MMTGLSRVQSSQVRRTHRYGLFLACCAGWFAAATSPILAADLLPHGYIKNFSVFYQRPVPGSVDAEEELWVVSNRLRLELNRELFPDTSAELAYDLVPRFQDTAFLDRTADELSFRPLQYRVADFDFNLWPRDERTRGSFALLQNLDRAALTWRSARADVIIGRQAIAWGSGRLVNPTDFLVPYSFTALDTEDRLGVDAVRVRVPTGALGEIDLGFVGGKDLESDRNAWFVRTRQYMHGTDVSAVTAYFREHLLLGLDVTRALGGAGAWLEAAYVDTYAFAGRSAGDPRGDDYFRCSVGMDRQLTADLYGFLEYHYSTAGAEDPEDYAVLSGNAAYRDGTVYLLGRNYVNGGVSLQATPLLTLSTVVLVNCNDASVAVMPEAQYNISQNTYLTFGGLLGLGEEPSGAPIPSGVELDSEFGAYADFVYFAIRWYF